MYMRRRRGISMWGGGWRRKRRSFGGWRRRKYGGVSLRARHMGIKRGQWMGGWR